MADPKTNLRVRISADLSQLQKGMGGLQKNLLGLKGMIAGAFAGLSAGALIGGIVRATAESEQALAQLEARLKSTKGAAGLTSKELVDMAGALQQVTTFGDEAIIGAETTLLMFKSIGRDIFPQATEATLNLATALGMDLQSAAQTVGRALESPEKATRALRAANVELREEQQKQIKSLLEAGRKMDAQKIILQSLESAADGAARAARNTLGGAFTAMKEALGDLLEGDSGSGGVRAVKQSINDLTRLLQDPSTKQAFAAMAESVFTLAGAMVSLGVKTKEAWDAMEGALIFRMGGTKQATDLKQIRYEMKQLQDLIDEFEASGKVKQYLARPDYNLAKKRLQELEALEQKSILLFGDPNAPKEPPTRHTRETEQAGLMVNPKPTKPKPTSGEEEAEAKKAAEARRREREREQKQLEAEAEARRQRIAAGLRDVEIGLDRAAGREAKAAFKEIDDKYRQLLEDLEREGKQADIDIVNELIDIEKADAQLAEFKRRFDQALEGFDKPGTGDALADEAELDAARQRSLGTMREQRDAAQAYADTLSGPAKDKALAAVAEMDKQLGGIKKGFAEITVAAADMASAGIADALYDWATGAESFSDALGHAVESFAQGMLRIATEAAALALTLKAFEAFMPGFTDFFMSMRGGSARVFHAGGIVGSGGGVRDNLSPMLWGAAPRYHSGGFAGLATDEVAAVLRKGEEVITEDDPRHTRNGGRNSGGSDVTVIVENNTSQPARTEEGTGADGGKFIKVIIDAAVGEVNKQIANMGSTGRTISQRFGVSATGVSRG